jgi:hypothetical protein
MSTDPMSLRALSLASILSPDVEPDPVIARHVFASLTFRELGQIVKDEVPEKNVADHVRERAQQYLWDEHPALAELFDRKFGRLSAFVEQTGGLDGRLQDVLGRISHFNALLIQCPPPELGEGGWPSPKARLEPLRWCFQVMGHEPSEIQAAINEAETGIAGLMEQHRGAGPTETQRADLNVLRWKTALMRDVLDERQGGNGPSHLAGLRYDDIDLPQRTIQEGVPEQDLHGQMVQHEMEQLELPDANANINNDDRQH